VGTHENEIVPSGDAYRPTGFGSFVRRCFHRRGFIRRLERIGIAAELARARRANIAGFATQGDRVLPENPRRHSVGVRPGSGPVPERNRQGVPSELGRETSRPSPGRCLFHGHVCHPSTNRAGWHRRSRGLGIADCCKRARVDHVLLSYSEL